MPFAPADLPLLLAGPIVRRVEPDLVCVWIATSQACNASLLLFEGAGVVGSDTPLGDMRAAWASDVQPSLQIGAHLHVLALVLDLRPTGGNAVRSGGRLLDNHPYSYDIDLFAEGDPTRRQTLRTLGLLEDPVPLGYDRHELPGFVTPPAERDKLVILHGSCRQLFAVPPVGDDPTLDDNPFHPPSFFIGDRKFDWPRAEPTLESPAHQGDEVPFPESEYPVLPKRDGMVWVDALIDQRGPAPRFAGRPHQLFLTGDQIYADGVPAAILPALHHVGRVLFGDEDLGAHPAEPTVLKDATLANFPPTFRRDTARRCAGFTSDDGSHLFAYGEFLAHYLLAWSPALWDLDLWPADDADLTKDFDPSTIPMPEDWRIGLTFADEVTGELSASYATLKAQLPVADSPPKDASPSAHVEWFFRQRRDWLTTRIWSREALEWWTRRLREGLPRVRRAFANVPTYMLADDHEVTDDLYFSRQWRERVFTRTLGVDTVRHGLMAYTAMQAWGNDPRRWASGPERELLDQLGAYALASKATRRTDFDRLHELLGLPRSTPGGTPQTFRPLVDYSYQLEGACHRVLVVDGRFRRRFPHRTSQAGGIDYEGGDGLLSGGVLPTGLPGEENLGFFGDSPMAAALPARPAGDDKLTIVVTGVPVLGPEGMELALVPVQRLARVLGEVDAEAWSYETGTYEALLAALARYGSVVLLSGDIHLGFTAFADYWSAPDGGPVHTARFVQLVSSGLTKDWGGRYSPPLRNHALTHDVFESATTPTLMHAERVGWGRPFREAPTPHVPSGEVVHVPGSAVAHPFYRLRLKARAPVVPTHGWPAGTVEAREPNWAWRAFMARDERPERTQPPDVEHRWTPVTRPANPIAPEAIGWHASAALRQAYGRVFAINQNVGVVTFERQGAEWSVRHVLAGDLPPLADTGPTPTGLRPYVVHRISLTPVDAGTWTSSRPAITADGGWGADVTDPALRPFLHVLPIIWRAAAGFPAAVWNDLPPLADDVAREAQLTDAAGRVSRTFRRRVLRELGPYALKRDDELDAVNDADVVALLQRQVGALDVRQEARAIVRPDLERVLAYHQSTVDPAAVLDDVLLLGCSDWVHEQQPLVGLVAGLLAALRSPITKHVPVLAGVLEGLWDVWRKHTFADELGQGTLLGLASVLPRLVVFALIDLIYEGAFALIDDQRPRRNKALPILTPELALAALGIYLGADGTKRLTYVSGWDTDERPDAPGSRRPDTPADVLARQTLSLLIHPGGRQRYTPPAHSLSLTLVPPKDAVQHGRLLAGWKGGIQYEGDIGGGVRQRVETDSSGFIDIPWGKGDSAAGTPGATLTMTFLRPLRFEPVPGIEVRLTPSIGASFGLARATGAPKPTFEARFSLNDSEDRVAFVPDDGLLRQLLPSDGISLPIDATVTYSPSRKWRFVGLGQAASGIAETPTEPEDADAPSDPADDFDDPPLRAPTPTEVVSPVQKKVGIVTLSERRLTVRTKASDDGATLSVALSGTLTFNLGPVHIAISGLGLAANLHLANMADQASDLIDLTFDPTMPTGLALSLDTDAITGGGFLQRIVDPDGRVTWRGGLVLRLADGPDVSAWGVVQTGGGQAFTLLVFITVRFVPPYPLPWGLKLTAVGGLLALNRTMDLDALRDAAVGAQGASLDQVFFPNRPEERLLELLPAIERFFPPAKGHQVVGLLAEIEWKADSGTTFGYFRGVLLGELENFQFALYGTARLGLPSLASDHILRLRASVEALYDHRNQFARFSLTIVEALLVKRVRITGGAALFFSWGAQDTFVLSVGGFHPAFRPFIPAGLREPPRFAAYWKCHRFVELTISGYVAITWCSFQLGFSAHMEVGASWGGLRADVDLDFIVMKKPRCLFELDLGLKVTAHVFGCDLFSATLRGSLIGPTPWQIEGTIYWEVCGVDMSKDFGPHVWGDTLGDLQTVEQQAGRVLADAFRDPTNWSLRRRPSMAVRLRAEAADALDPHDELDVRQTELPLDVPLEVYDANRLSDPGAWRLVAGPGLTKLTDLTDVFPARRFQRKPRKEEPFKGGLAAGARFGGAGWNVPQTLAIASDESQTEDSILDIVPVTPAAPTAPVHVRLVDALLVAGPTTAVERRWTRHAVVLESVA